MSDQQVDFKSGDEFWVKVGRKSYKTIIDERGTQRFEKVPAIDEAWKRNPNLSITKAIDYQEGRLSLLDFIEWNMGLGYSVGGLEDVISSTLDRRYTPSGTRRQITISNPLWNNGEPEVWRG